MELIGLLERFNIKSYDALHLASAEAGGADVFLTTGRRLIKAAQRANAGVKVQNPLAWLAEVLYDRES
jgi:predicted nucleic acid-binding protein